MAKIEQNTVPEIIDSVEALTARMKAMRKAQEVFATYTQEQVDKIFFEAAKAANMQRIPLAKMAVAETGMGYLTRSSRTTMRQSIFTMPTRTPKPAASLKRTRHSASRRSRSLSALLLPLSLRQTPHLQQSLRP